MIRKILGLGIPATAALLAAMPGDAQAACCVAYQPQHVEATVGKAESSIKGHFTTQINAMQLAIIEAQRLSTGQISGNLKEQNAANANIADLQDDRAVVARIEEARIQAMRDSASGASVCNVITGNLGGGSIRAVRELKKRHLGKQMVNWHTGNEGPSSRGQAAAVEARLVAHCDYATEHDVKTGVCEVAAAEPLQNADVSATNSLFFIDENTGTLDPARQKAAQQFVINVFDPRPPGALPAGIAGTPAGRELLAERNTNAGRTSLAVAAANDYITRREPLNRNVIGADNKAQSLNEWAEETAKDVLGYNPNGGNFPNGVGWYDWMDLRSRSWFMHSKWAAEAKSPGQTIKDMAMMQAFEVYQNWETFKMLENINITLAAQLAILTESTRDIGSVPGSGG